MKVTTYEAIVQDGRVVLPDGAHMPDNTRVSVVVPATNDAERGRIMSPRLVHRDEVADFAMHVERVYRLVWPALPCGGRSGSSALPSCSLHLHVSLGGTNE